MGHCSQIHNTTDLCSPVFCAPAHLFFVPLQLCQNTQLLQHGQEDSFTSSSTDVCDGTAQLLQQSQHTGSYHDEQRWVPYRHTNGVAIYHHKESAATCSLWDSGQVRHDKHSKASAAEKRHAGLVQPTGHTRRIPLQCWGCWQLSMIVKTVCTLHPAS